MSATALSPFGLDNPKQVTGRIVGKDASPTSGVPIVSRSPIDGATLTELNSATVADVNEAIAQAHSAFTCFRLIPAPVRGEFVRRIGQKLREHKQELAAVVTLEAGKIPSEAAGEVQEMIDICDYAVGLSRQLFGLTIATERPGHRMMETWHPLGVVGVISAFNFPVAVWAWNAMIALVCGDTVVWKPSEKTPLCALATQRIVARVIEESPDLEIPQAVSSVVIGGAEIGQALAQSTLVPLVSATGSTRMGKAVATTVAQRLGRSLLELGGNNAMIVAPSADIELAVRAITFSAFGTAGQRCTTLRRLIAHESVYDQIVPRVTAIAARLNVGDPRLEGVLLGPLIDQVAFDGMQATLAQARSLGAIITGGQRVTAGTPAAGFYVRPAIVENISHASACVQQETFAPVLYCFKYKTLEDAIAMHNAVPQGLSSAIFTTDVREAEWFVSAAGSDCGIANVNIGTSGAEIGGAFGGEKETGGGRESGSDSWKNYMRRATNTINYSTRLPLAQGVSFEV